MFYNEHIVKMRIENSAQLCHKCGMVYQDLTKHVIVRCAKDKLQKN